jgi:hypothetical protein
MSANCHRQPVSPNECPNRSILIRPRGWAARAEGYKARYPNGMCRCRIALDMFAGHAGDCDERPRK